MTETNPISQHPAAPRFISTHWTVVLSAGDPSSPHAATALETLCRAYWYPLYAYVRRRGHSTSQAQDITQEFFMQLLEHNWVARVDRHKGRFRSFLLMAMKRFLANEWDKVKTQKRGGYIQFVSLQLDTAEIRYIQELADTSTPEQVYEKQWALTLLESVLDQLHEEYVQDGKAILFDKLKSCLVGSSALQPYAQLAAELDMTEGSVKVAVCRLRQRYREQLKEEIAQTVASVADVEDELHHLFRVLARH
jgi:RNA polymerase sigma-70 factor (ECF subfamily)